MPDSYPLDTSNFPTTKMLVEIEIQTQFGPKSAKRFIEDNLRYPAVQKVRVVSMESNFNPAGGPPLATFSPVSVEDRNGKF